MPVHTPIPQYSSQADNKINQLQARPDTCRFDAITLKPIDVLQPMTLAGHAT